MSKDKLKSYILEIQDLVKEELSTGIEIDDFLDKTSIFDEFEDIIPDEEFPIQATLISCSCARDNIP